MAKSCHAAQFRQQLRMARVLVPGRPQGGLADRRGDDAVHAAGQRQLRRGDDRLVRRLPRTGVVAAERDRETSSPFAPRKDVLSRSESRLSRQGRAGGAGIAIPLRANRSRRLECLALATQRVARRITSGCPTTNGRQIACNSALAHAAAMISGPTPAASPIVIASKGFPYDDSIPHLLRQKEKWRKVPIADGDCLLGST